MANHAVIQIVASHSTLEAEEEFNRWYTDVHVPMLFSYEGVKQASRYQLIGNEETSSKFLAIYEFDTKEAMEAFLKSPEFAVAVEDFENNKEKIGFSLEWAASYELIKSWKR